MYFPDVVDNLFFAYSSLIMHSTMNHGDGRCDITKLANLRRYVLYVQLNLFGMLEIHERQRIGKLNLETGNLINH
jgi:hypothetical protein